MSELRVRRLVVEDDQGRPRAVIECGESPDPPRGAPVRLRLLAASGDPMIELRLDEAGEPRLSVGHPDRGAAVIVLLSEVQVWKGGNEMAALSTSDGARLILRDAEGRDIVIIPRPTKAG